MSTVVTMSLFRVNWDNRSDVYSGDNDQVYNFASNYNNRKHIEGLSQHVCWVTFLSIIIVEYISLLDS